MRQLSGMATESFAEPVNVWGRQAGKIQSSAFQAHTKNVVHCGHRPLDWPLTLIVGVSFWSSALCGEAARGKKANRNWPNTKARRLITRCFILCNSSIQVGVGTLETHRSLVSMPSTIPDKTPILSHARPVLAQIEVDKQG